VGYTTRKSDYLTEFQFYGPKMPKSKNGHGEAMTNVPKVVLDGPTKF